MKVNYHVHTAISDGQLSSEQILLEAIKEGLTHICFTDHYNLAKKFSSEKEEKLRKYFEELRILRDKYKANLDISIGAEFDWDKGISHLYEEEIKKLKLDFVIGSVHWVSSGKTKIGFWDNEDLARETIKSFGVRNYLESYYDNISEMIKSGLFDCVAHFDIIKLNSPKWYDFSEDESWYRKKVLETLDVLANSGMCMEINMRGMAKQGKDKQYPSFWILQEAKKRNIPVTIGNDFHNMKYGKFDDLIDEAYKLAREAGYESVLVFKNRKSLEVKI